MKVCLGVFKQVWHLSRCFSPLPAGALTVYREQILHCVLKVRLQFYALRYFSFLPDVSGAGMWDINENTSLLEAKD